MESEKIHSRLKQLRNRHGLSQTALAKKIGVTPSYVSAMERGEKNITRQIVEKLIELFEVSADWLISGNDTNSLNQNEHLILKGLNTQSEKTGAFDTKSGQNKHLNIRSSSENDAALLASNFDVESLESVRGTGGPSSLNPWATGYIIELQQNQHWLNIDRQLRRALGRLLRVRELLQDLVGVSFEEGSYEALKNKVNRQMDYDAPDGLIDPVAKMSEAQKRTYYASRERLLEECEAQFSELFNKLHMSITHPANLNITPRKGSAGEVLRPFLMERYRWRFGEEPNE